MVVEHVSFNVSDPIAFCDWWVKNLGFKITVEGPAPADCRFITDSSGKFAFEIQRAQFRGATLTPPDYPTMAAVQLHIAFPCDDVQATADALVKAGATIDADEQAIHRPGFDMIMLRDPWGIPLQLVKRANSVFGK